MRKTLVLGGPGAGKTERLLRKILRALEDNVPPSKIAFASFTKGAVEVAIKRACDMFGLTPDDLPNFRTIHSFAFREIGLRREDVIGDDHLAGVHQLETIQIDHPRSDRFCPQLGIQQLGSMADQYVRQLFLELVSARAQSLRIVFVLAHGTSFSRRIVSISRVISAIS